METTAADPQVGAVSPLQGDYDFLRAAAQLPDREAAALVRWWNRGRQPNETLLAFLEREELLTARERQLIAISTAHITGIPVAVVSHAARMRLRNRATQLLERPKSGPPPGRVDPPKPAAVEPVKPATTVDFIGRTVGRVRIDSLLGEGGYGMVYRGHHERLDVPVAVKFLRCRRSDVTQKVLDRLVAEARLMAKLNHINVVRLWDFDDEHDPPYLMMEFVDGPSVQALIADGNRLPARASLKIVREVGRGLRAAAQIGIVHRDIKPANILIGPDGVAKVTDFGLAILADDPSVGAVHLRRQESGVCGTAEYLAPEQVAGTPATHQSDMYSLGATLYHMITGRAPFEGGTNLQVLHNAATKPVVDPCKLVAGLEPRIGRFVCRLLSKAADARFASYDELFREMDELIERRRN